MLWTGLWRACKLVALCAFVVTSLITILPNYLHDYKIKPQKIPIGSFTVPKLDANSEAKYEDDDDIEPMYQESAALDEIFIIINDEGAEYFDMEYEEHKEDNWNSIYNNPD